ncbi:oxygen-dependent choline dehydrogenase, FAD/NAD(P)-binding domain protein [Artemisia annua]|uniref:Oxygen-dependent choline dehydrogenase, FAD/NAD(P)-binding domain protein n=1 Tax=Artemisia annua TaxID=35608 RepID=A0A2U1P155_ARTAN|nr:oxygen-dependent choline dehydrogenase, FAD/NAD(P)-binding domain protein [Artemisia annua]
MLQLLAPPENPNVLLKELLAEALCVASLDKVMPRIGYHSQMPTMHIDASIVGQIRVPTVDGYSSMFVKMSLFNNLGHAISMTFSLKEKTLERPCLILQTVLLGMSPYPILKKLHATHRNHINRYKRKSYGAIPGPSSVVSSQNNTRSRYAKEAMDMQITSSTDIGPQKHSLASLLFDSVEEQLPENSPSNSTAQNAHPMHLGHAYCRAKFWFAERLGHFFVVIYRRGLTLGFDFDYMIILSFKMVFQIGYCKPEPTPLYWMYHDKIDAPLDPTKELSRYVYELAAAKRGLGLLIVSVNLNVSTLGMACRNFMLDCSISPFDKSPRVEQYTILPFADALDAVTMALAENSGLSPIETLAEVKAKLHAAADLLQYANPKGLCSFTCSDVTLHKNLFKTIGKLQLSLQNVYIFWNIFHLYIGVVFEDLFGNNHQAYLKGGKQDEILSAGALASPQLLMLSDIGPRKQLDTLKIKVVLEQP